MIGKVLRRRVIIRKYDFDKISKLALSESHGYRLYDRATFIPLNKTSLEKLRLEEILKGKTGKLSSAEWPNVPTHLLYYLNDYLYNKEYLKWKLIEESDGLIYVQAKKNTPKTCIGWAVLEKDMYV